LDTLTKGKLHSVAFCQSVGIAISSSVNPVTELGRVRPLKTTLLIDAKLSRSKLAHRISTCRHTQPGTWILEISFMRDNIALRVTPDSTARSAKDRRSEAAQLGYTTVTRGTRKRLERSLQLLPENITTQF
jgi:hypothetical protein